MFTFPAVARTAIANKRNWNCDGVVIRERVLPPEQEEKEAQDEEEEFDEGDEGDKGDVGDAQEQDTPPFGDSSNVPPPPPSPNPNLPHTLTWVGRLPHPKCLMMRLSSNFLRIFRWMLPGYGGYTAMQSDFHRMAERMDSIEEGVSYFRGYVNIQEAREERRMRCEEEQAMREAREYEEWRRLNELLW